MTRKIWNYGESKEKFLEWYRKRKENQREKLEKELEDYTGLKGWFVKIVRKKQIIREVVLNFLLFERRVRNNIIALFLLFLFYWLIFSDILWGMLWALVNTIPLFLNILNENGRQKAKDKGLFIKEFRRTAKIDRQFQVDAAYPYYENRQTVILLGFTLIIFTINYHAISFWPIATILTMVIMALGIITAFKLGEINTIFTLIKEPYSKIIVRKGQYRKTLIASRGRYLDKGGNIVPSLSQVQDIPQPHNLLQKIVSFLSLGGLRFMGLPGDEVKKFSYTVKDVVQKEEGGRQKFDVVEKKIESDSIPLSFQTTHIWVVTAETKDMPTVEVILVYYYYINNPSKFGFKSDDFYNAVIGIVDPFMRQLIAQYGIKELFHGREKVHKEIERTLRKNINRFSQIDEDFGVTTFNIELWNLDPSKPETVKMLELPWETKQEKEQIEIKAQAERYRIEQIFEKINSMPNGLEIFKLEVMKAIGEAGKGVYFFPMDIMTAATSAIKKLGGK